MKRGRNNILIFLLCLSFQLLAQDTIVVQFAHGSKPKKQYKDEHKTLGGKMGGHVVIQINQYVYGFHFAGHKVHIFPHHKNRNGVFQKQSLAEWETLTKDKKLTKVFIPINKEDKESLLVFFDNNIAKPSYDYSFFGQRCTSTVYNQLKALHKMSGGGRFGNAFYPAQLRKKLLKQSKAKGYLVTVKPGSVKRTWEGN